MTGRRIELFPKQADLVSHILNPKTRVVIYGGGIRGGKTFAALVGMFTYLKYYAGARATIVRDSIPTLFRNTVPSFNKLGLAKTIENEQQLRQNITYFNSQVNFFAENYDADKELNRWKGLETNLFILEEFNELNEASFWKAVERVGSWIVPATTKNPNPLQPPPKIICTCNPSNGWVKKLVYDRWKSGTLPDGWVYIPSLAFDNPHLPEAYLENLKSLPAKHYNVYVKGIWEDLKLENLFAEEFDRDRHIGKTVYDPELPVILSFDFNVKNSCLVIQKRSMGTQPAKIRVLREYSLAGGIESVCQKIKSDWKGSRVMFSGDATGQARSGLTAGNEGYWRKIMAAFGHRIWNNKVFRVPKANPSHKASYLQSEVIFKHYDILIDESCIELVNDLEQVQILSKGEKMEIDKSDPLRSHLLDCLRYFFDGFCPEAFRFVPDSLKETA